FDNTGAAAAVFQVRSRHSPVAPPTYTGEGGKSRSDFWGGVSAGASEDDLSRDGPKGLTRTVQGNIGSGGANLDVRASCAGATVESPARYGGSTGPITTAVTNGASSAVPLATLDVYSGTRTSRAIAAGVTGLFPFGLSGTFGWYEFVITADNDPGFETRFAG